MSFDYKKFRNTIIQKYKNILDEAVIDDLLDLGDEGNYSRDTPTSTGRRLILMDLTIKGKKSNGEEINFFQEFKEGINITIADNLRGKSSIFKAIQFALTGNSKLKNDIKKLFDLILLNFKISEKAYCVYMNMESNVLSGSLYSNNFRTVEDIELSGISAIFNERSEDKFSKEMESFFFGQFSYYYLKWTQKSPNKNSNELLECKASWHTYFKSIFLESKDTNSDYGDQEKKIFQMLLGLHLTYPINRLKIKKDKKESEKARKSDSNVFIAKSSSIDRKELETRIVNLNIEIDKSRSFIENGIKFEEYSERRKAISNQITQVDNEYFKAQSDLREARTELYTIEGEYRRVEQEVNKICKNILQIEKEVQNLQEFLDIGRLFSNLEIKYCPCCNKKMKDINSLFNEYRAFTISEKFYFFDCNAHEILGSFKESDIYKFLRAIILNEEENPNIRKKAIELHTEYILINKLKPRYALDILIEFWAETQDIFLEVRRLKDLFLFYELEPDDIKKIYQLGTNNDEVEIQSESYFHLGLIYFLSALKSEQSEFEKILQDSLSAFEAAFEVIENRIDAEFFKAIISFILDLIEGRKDSSNYHLSRLTDILWRRDILSISNVSSPFWVSFYKVLLSISKADKLLQAQWLDYRENFLNLHYYYCEIKNDELKDRLAQSLLKEDFSKYCIASFFDPYILISPNYEVAKIDARLKEVSADSDEYEFLSYLKELGSNSDSKLTTD